MPFILAASGCGAEAAFDPADVAGRYPLSQVDGHAPGWYHQLGAIDCQAAFIAGKLEIQPTGAFDLDLDYDFRCIGTDPFDGSGNLSVYGSSMREEGEVLMLYGFGPDLINPPSTDHWTLEARRSGSQLIVRFVGFARTYWGDPVLTLGPKQE